MNPVVAEALEPQLNEMELAYIGLLQHAQADAIHVLVYAHEGQTYPALVTPAGEVLALLCIPPRVYDISKVN